MPIVVIALVLVLGYVVLSRVNEIFCLSVRNGRTIVVRGDLPASLFDGLSEIMAGSSVERATIRATKGEHHARLVVSGVDDRVVQRCRNVFGLHPIQQLRSAELPRGARNLGQRLGFVWLAWLLSPRR